MSGVGRNELCPCGSGKKYKKCCLEKEMAPTDDVFRRRIQTMRNGLIGKILKHIDQGYGPLAIDEAWDEFHLWTNEEPFDPEAREMQVFMPFFFYDWFPDEAETEVNPDAPMDVPPAMALLGLPKNRLEPLEKEYIEECCSKAFTFFEVLEAWPGKGFKGKDILTEELYEIFERSGSEHLEAGDIIFGKAVTLQNLTTLEACSTYLIPPKYKLQLLDLKKALKKDVQTITHNYLRDNVLEVLDMYHDIRDELENPRMPILQNTDGEPMAPHKLTYEIESLEAAVEKLAPLALRLTKEEILEDVKINSQGVKSVEFPWNKKGNKINKGWDSTVMGHIKIVGNQMIVDVNSAKRAALFESKLKKLMPTDWKLKSKVIDPVEQYLKNAHNKEEHEVDHEHEELNNRPEVQAALAAMMKKHWENWVKQKIPALGNITPLEATKTADGREALDALLTQFERDAGRRAIPGQTVETFQALRERLGI